MSDVLWRRLRYFLSPQWDHYHAIAPHLKGKAVLDIGCGTGFGAVQLAAFATRVHGTDIDADAIAFCQSSWPGERLDFSVSDILVARPWSFDAVVMIEVLEHVVDRGLALQNIRSLLNPGGVFYVSARNALADLRRNDLHEDEKTATELFAELSPLFSSVELYDYSLTKPQTDQSRVTPIVAVCIK